MRLIFPGSAPAWRPASTTFRPRLCGLRAAYTNTVPVDAYRGAGRPEASYVIERLVDAAARELGIAPDALRRKNFIRPKAMPYTTPTGKIYDSGEFAGSMARAQEIADWNGFNKRAAARSAPASCAASASRPISRPAATTGRKPRPCGSNGRRRHRADRLAVDRAGPRHGLCADRRRTARLPPERVRMLQGDTDQIATGAGTGGSSSIPVGGVSVDGAAKSSPIRSRNSPPTRSKPRAGDLEIADGTVRVAGTDRAISFAELAAHPQAKPERLARRDDFGPSSRPIRTAPTSPKSRSIPRPAISRSSITSSSTISA